MNVWVLQTGEPLPVDPGSPRPMRAINLCNELVRSGHNVVLWSADFSHQEKKFRYRKNQSIRLSENLEVRLLQSPGYKKNIGLMRLYDHARLALGLRRALRAEKQPPDVAFVGYPPIEIAFVMLRWLERRGVPALLDIKDQWPVIFVEALPGMLQPLGRLAFAPYYYLARKSMRLAAGISTMAGGYLEWARNFSGRNSDACDGIFPLTSPQGQVSRQELEAAQAWWDARKILDDGCQRVCFVGSLSPAFDFLPVRDAAREAQREGNAVQFIICGDGGSAAQVRALMAGLPNVVFPGWIDRPKVEALAQRCNAALTPYVNSENFKNNLPNKVIDALALGLPLLSPLAGEVQNLIEKHEVGLAYGRISNVSLYQCLQQLNRNPQRRATMSQNARALYAQRFAFDIVYPALVRHLESLTSKK